MRLVPIEINLAYRSEEIKYAPIEDGLIKTLSQTRTGDAFNFVACDVKPIYITPKDKLSI